MRRRRHVHWGSATATIFLIFAGVYVLLWIGITLWGGM